MIGETVMARIILAINERNSEYDEIATVTRHRRKASALFIGDTEFADLQAMVAHWEANVVINHPSGYNPRTGQRAQVYGCLLYRVDAETFLAVI
jgi:hypothetical protein